MSTDIRARINELKKQRNAVILAHNYQLGEVQDIADFSGDSLELSRKAAETEAAVIVFCGVHFMAETAAILSPDKTVLLPDFEAGCPMADMITGTDLRALKEQHPNAKVICYVNSTAEVKAESDCCCTSANAPAVANSFPADQELIFVPDKYLCEHTAQLTGRKMIFWHGYCPTHARILDTHILELKAKYPNAVAMAHPECTQPVRDAADEVLSTGGMCRFVQQSDATEFVVATEIGILHRLRKENPDKTFYPATEMGICPNMKRIRLEKVLWSLEKMQYVVQVPPEIRERAITAIDRMLRIAS